MLELSLAKWRKEISSAETKELESLKKAYPPDPEDPLKDAVEAWRRAAKKCETSRREARRS
jgi:hypothetical protein